MLFSLNRRQFGIALLALATIASAGKSQASTLEDLKQKGVVVIGIQGDNAPWGFVDSSGKQGSPTERGSDHVRPPEP